MRIAKSLCIVLVFGVASAASAALSTARFANPSVRTTFDGGGTVHIDAASNFTGFEPGEGYVPGPIEPQQGWQATGTNLPWASVTTANPFAGAQNLRLIRDTTVGQGTDSFAVSPNLGAQPVGPQASSMMVNISNDNGADYLVAGQSLAQGSTTWEVVFFFSDLATGTQPGRILVTDDLGSGLQFVDTGVTWNPGVYRQLRVETNPAANTIDYFYNGAHIYSSVSGMWGATMTEQLVIDDDNFQLAGETGDFDNLSIADVPEPTATLGIVAIGGVALLPRRRRA